MSVQSTMKKFDSSTTRETPDISEFPVNPLNPLRMRLNLILSEHKAHIRKENSQKRWRALREDVADVVETAADDIQDRIGMPQEHAEWHADCIEDALQSRLELAEEKACCTPNPRYDVQRDDFWRSVGSRLLDYLAHREDRIVGAWY